MVAEGDCIESTSTDQPVGVGNIMPNFKLQLTFGELKNSFHENPLDLRGVGITGVSIQPPPKEGNPFIFEEEDDNEQEGTDGNQIIQYEGGSAASSLRDNPHSFLANFKLDRNAFFERVSGNIWGNKSRELIDLTQYQDNTGGGFRCPPTYMTGDTGDYEFPGSSL